jgi:hypothetical protein
MRGTVEGNESTVTVRYQPTFAGRSVEGYEFSITFGANDTLAYASGIIGDTSKIGSYELATLERAVERLNQQRVYPARGAAEPAIAQDVSAPTDQEPLVVKLTAVRVGLMLSSDDTGNQLWLTPAYVFTPSDTSYGVDLVVPAAADKYFPTTTTGVDTKPPASDDVPPVSGGDPGSIEPAPATKPPATVAP